jgi:hypothetical protein
MLATTDYTNVSAAADYEVRYEDTRFDHMIALGIVEVTARGDDRVYVASDRWRTLAPRTDLGTAARARIAGLVETLNLTLNALASV